MPIQIPNTMPVSQAPIPPNSAAHVSPAIGGTYTQYPIQDFTDPLNDSYVQSWLEWLNTIFPGAVTPDGEVDPERFPPPGSAQIVRDGGGPSDPAVTPPRGSQQEMDRAVAAWSGETVGVEPGGAGAHAGLEHAIDTALGRTGIGMTVLGAVVGGLPGAIAAFGARALAGFISGAAGVPEHADSLAERAKRALGLSSTQRQEGRGPAISVSFPDNAFDVSTPVGDDWGSGAVSPPSPSRPDYGAGNQPNRGGGGIDTSRGGGWSDSGFGANQPGRGGGGDSGGGGRGDAGQSGGAAADPDASGPY